MQRHNYLLLLIYIFSSMCRPGAAQNAYPYYFSGSGTFTDNCPMAVCETCPIGQWRKDCGEDTAHINAGICANCDQTLNGGVFTSHGYFNNSCSFACLNGYASNPSGCVAIATTSNTGAAATTGVTTKTPTTTAAAAVTTVIPITTASVGTTAATTINIATTIPAATTTKTATTIPATTTNTATTIPAATTTKTATTIPATTTNTATTIQATTTTIPATTTNVIPTTAAAATTAAPPTTTTTTPTTTPRPVTTTQLPTTSTAAIIPTTTQAPPCTLCGVGEWKTGCPGQCSICTNMPRNGEAYTTDGGFANLCQFNCSFGYVKNESLCWVKNAVYVTAVSMTFQMNISDFQANKGTLIQAFSNASGCGMCRDTAATPVICGICIIQVNSLQILPSSRRLLTDTIMVNSSLEVRGAETVAKQISTQSMDLVALNRELSTTPIPPVQSVTAALVSVTQLTPSPPPPIVASTTTSAAPPPPPTPQPSSSESAGISIGLVAGAAGGGIVGIGIIGLVIYCALKPAPSSKRENKQESVQKTPPPPPTPGPPAQARASLVYYDPTKKKSTLRISMSNPVLNRPRGGNPPQICR